MCIRDSLSPDGSHIASGDAGRDIKVYKIGEKEPLVTVIDKIERSCVEKVDGSPEQCDSNKLVPRWSSSGIRLS